MHQSHPFLETKSLRLLCLNWEKGEDDDLPSLPDLGEAAPGIPELPEAPEAPEVPELAEPDLESVSAPEAPLSADAIQIPSMEGEVTTFNIGGPIPESLQIKTPSGTKI